MLLNNLTTYFYVRPSSVTGKKGCLYMRVSCDKRIVFSSSIKNIRIDPEEFDHRTQTPKRGCEMGVTCSMFIQAARDRLNEMHISFEKKGMVISKDLIKRVLPEIGLKAQGEHVALPSFLSEFKSFMDEMEMKIGRTVSMRTWSTYNRYRTRSEIILKEMGLLGLPMQNFTPEDIMDYQNRLAAKYGKGTVMRQMYLISSVFQRGVEMGRITKNPCKGIKRVKQVENPDMVWLEHSEVEKLAALELDGLLDQFRDAFLFCCWTGLAVGDYQLLNPRSIVTKSIKNISLKDVDPGHIVKNKDGVMLIGRRRKTGTSYRVPLLPEARAIIGKYGGIEHLPFNVAKSGASLQALMKMIGVQKKIRFHTARKTFANYLINVRMLNPMYVIEIMGWLSIDEAKPYVKVDSSTLARALL